MARVLQSLDLFGVAPVEAARRKDDSRPASGRLQLWIAVCLPSLAFESLGVADSALPAVVVEAERGQLHVVAASHAAAEAGISSEMKLNTAMALAASLQVFERSPSLERQSLESLATWAESLTSMVSVEAPESLLLEVAGSLTLFGSLDALKAKLRGELALRYRDFRFCAAPTATAALWLARAASADVLQWQQLAGSLAALPLAVTRWPSEVQALLHDLGLRTVGDCARLPRDGFARRIGRRYLLELDRAFGRCVDLRGGFKVPYVWSSTAELAEESVDSAIFIEAVEQLLDELCAELTKRQAQIDGLEIFFEHLHRPPTVESFDLRDPTHDRDRLLHLIEDRFERSALPVPAVALRLKSGVFRPLEHKAVDLFEAKPHDESAQVLLERLQERFGSSAVYGLCAVPEHRPEKAWAKRLENAGGAKQGTRGDVGTDARGRAVQGAIAGLARQARPLWLLQKPVAIEASQESLKLVSGPERIESGWWDDQDVARDYYTARNGNGQRLWVFRDRRTRSWFLHGLFG
jgi:protein ImuB